MALITIDNQLRIDSIIDSLSQRIGVSYPEDNLIDIANKAGVQVLEVDLHTISPTLSGAITYDNPKIKSEPTIFIEKTLHNNRKTFTLAHELGHHFLHEGTKLRLDDLDYSKEDIDTTEETEANYFAASLLVPKELFIAKLNDGLSIDKLAEFFGVSVPVIRNRLKWLRAN